VAADAARRLKTCQGRFELVLGAEDLPKNWPPESRGDCVAIAKLIAAYLGNDVNVEGLPAQLQIVFSLCQTGQLTADAQAFEHELDVSVAEARNRPAYLIRIDLKIVDEVRQVAGATLASIGATQLQALFGGGSSIDMPALTMHITWMALMLVFLHAYSHCIRCHLAPGRAARIARAALPADANIDLVEELDADLIANTALAVLLQSFSRSLPADINHNQRQFAVASMACRTMFAALSRYAKPAIGQTHPARPARIYWCVRDAASRFEIDDASVRAFFALVDCRLGFDEQLIAQEEQRQAQAWKHWKELRDSAFFSSCFSPTS